MFQQSLKAITCEPCASPVGRVLVVDEDPEVRGSVISFLIDQNWSAIGAGQSELPRHLQSQQLSLVALNARLRSANALDVVRQIRSSSDVPLIMYQGKPNDEVDRVVSLELGADDVMYGTLNLNELVARARAILRRQELGRLSPQPTRGGYRFEAWELRHATRSLTAPSGAEVSLTRSEYALLCALLEAPGRTLSRLQLMRASRTHDDIYDRSIDVQVLRLRRKLVAHVPNTKLIRTERGFGYRLEAKVETLY